MFSKIQSACNLGRLAEALKLLSSNPTRLDPSLYLKILQLCIDKKAKKQGHLIHTHLITNGFGSDLHLNTKLIIFYVKVGDVIAARNVFDGMPERSVVSWTAMVSGYSQNGRFEKAFVLFSDMRHCGVKANQFTYGSALRACTSLRCLDMGIQVQGCIQKGRFVENLFVKSALVDFHSKCGKMEDASYLFGTMMERDVVSWNAMIGGYAVQGFADDSFCMFRSMLRGGLVPDCYTLGSVLRASAEGGGLIIANQIHGIITQLGYGSYDIVTGLLINAYAKNGSLRSAKDLRKGMLKKDLFSSTALITGYAHEGIYSVDALDLFKEMNQMNIGMDDVILCSMLNICANLASFALGTQIHAFALKYQPSYDVAMGNALIDMYAKSGEIEDAKRAFDEMEEKNVISWTSLISGYAKHGHTGLTAEGCECFNNMVNKYNIKPRAEHYSCMVDLFARQGLLEEAYNLLCKIDIKHNASLWGAILGASSIYGYMSLGKEAASNLFNMQPENSVNYVVLASIYSAAGLWDDAWKIRKLMEERSTKKNAGYSFFQATKKSIPLLQAS
eukprot:XP_019072972.1 PREDICTED: pentatricopeptide repeat-containing protein At3g20730 isoform X2 [Vitis vinifera]